MSDESSKTPFGPMNRRTMLGTSTALVGGAIAGAAGSAFGQEKAPAAAPAAAPATSVNMAPPILQLECGKVRGLKEGKTFSFLGIRYAEAERFGQPKAIGPWEGVKNAQSWGPVCPAPEQTSVSGDELVFPHRY